MNFIILSVLVLALDQATKYLVKSSMYLNQSVPVIKPFVYLTYIRNEGAAFGLFQGFTPVFIISSLMVIGAIIYYYRISRPSSGITTGLALIAGGALGNLIDRLIHHAVIDFIDLRMWPVFNLADCAIVVGALLLVFFLMQSSEKGEAGF